MASNRKLVHALVKVCLHVACTVSPALTLMIFPSLTVGFGPPLQATSVVVTSLIGYQKLTAFTKQNLKDIPHRNLSKFCVSPVIIIHLSLILCLLKILPLYSKANVLGTRIACPTAKILSALSSKFDLGELLTICSSSSGQLRKYRVRTSNTQNARERQDILKFHDARKTSLCPQY